jgi:hypothetical protein
MPTSGKRRSAASRKAIDRPFDREVLRRARQVVDAYQIVVRVEDGEYVGRGLELPESIGVGGDAKACVEEARAVMTTVVAYMLEGGQSPPPPASEGVRTEQVNIRFSAEEKLALETAARQQGFRSVTDYVRATALANRPPR